jgi:sulfite reductase (NADPH) hemoprotein beta-component
MKNHHYSAQTAFARVAAAEQPGGGAHMYAYSAVDQRIIEERVTQFRDQTARYLRGELSESQFLPLRLQNGLYRQRLAPMLRIAVPYGLLSSKQLRAIARISRDYDKGYAHVSTRQNLQLNWPRLEDVPDLLADLAAVQMHAIQTSGNCIRNTTTDPFAGVAVDEVTDPRPWCELIRQWSTLHPEFAFLPRKFKIAVSASAEDRAATHFHDVGVHLYRNGDGDLRLRFLVGGGLGRTPMVASHLRDDVEPRHLLTYLEAILRVYNLRGRRDNKYKARIKILVKAMGIEAFRAAVDAEWATLRDGQQALTDRDIEAMQAHFTAPPYAELDGLAEDAVLRRACDDDTAFSRWVARNTRAHKRPGYRAVTVSLKAPGQPPGDISAAQMERIADLAERFSFGELRTTHEQNMVLADVAMADLPALWDALRRARLGSANAGHAGDIICCPGGDYCSLANAKSIPVARELQERLEALDAKADLGPLELNISGCMNACGHHHVGHIGVLGVDKKGAEFYQVCVGGSQAGDARVADILGPSVSRAELSGLIDRLLDCYLEQRHDGEHFLGTFSRLGVDHFRERIYGQA